MPLYHGLSEYWRLQQDFGRSRRDAGRLCAVASRPRERTYQALGRRALAQIAIGENRWDEAQAQLAEALKLIEGATAPLAQWRVYVVVAECHQAAGRTSDADRYRAASAAVLTRLGDSLTDAPGLRQCLLNAPAVRSILSRSPGPPSLSGNTAMNAEQERGERDLSPV